MIKRIAAVIVMLAACSTAAFADSVIRVVRAAASPAQMFKCGERCRFRANAPLVPLRLRVFRGTKAELSRTGNDPRYVNATGCVEYSSMIIRPQNPRRPQNVLDLRFFFKPKWLNGEYDGQFVFVIEYDDQPNSTVTVEENPPKLRLAANMTDDYFGSGIDVTIRAPLYASARMSRTTRARSRSGSEPAMMTEIDALPIERRMPGAPIPVRTVASNDCISVQIDPGAPILIQRTDARPPEPKGKEIALSAPR